ncbi:MAG TPA: MFS transporter [Gammaproteobacteria bacterium]
MQPQPGITPSERRAASSLAVIYALRMLGLFMILPVFALYAEHLDGVTPLTVGLAISAYGLTQALFQIPFGLASDYLGRKPVIVFGLLLFAAGSVVAGLAESIEGVIVGRALQGSGAIAAAVLALAADLTREEVRTRVMAFIGASIGMSFALALVLGPVLNRAVGVPGIFFLTAALALGGIAVVTLLVPRAPIIRHRDAEPVRGQFAAVLRDPELLRLDAGILVLHAILTATFVVLPLVLRDRAGLPAADHWLLYLPVLVLSLALMVPFVIVAERRRKLREVFLGAIGVLGCAQLGLYLAAGSLAGLVVALVVMFAAFNLLEASLPSLVSKIAPASRKGTAMGVYSTAQFFGAFLGGALGGAAHGAFGATGVFLFCAGLTVTWLLLALPMRPPRYLASRMLQVGPLSPRQAQDLSRRIGGIPGVVEAVVVAEEGVAYLKVDSGLLDEAALREFSPASA